MEISKDCEAQKVYRAGKQQFIERREDREEQAMVSHHRLQRTGVSKGYEAQKVYRAGKHQFIERERGEDRKEQAMVSHYRLQRTGVSKGYEAQKVYRAGKHQFIEWREDREEQAMVSRHRFQRTGVSKGYEAQKVYRAGKQQFIEWGEDREEQAMVSQHSRKNRRNRHKNELTLAKYIDKGSVHGIDKLPFHLLEKILGLLPLRTLYSSRAVSRLWCNLVGGSDWSLLWEREGPWMCVVKDDRSRMRPLHSITERDVDEKDPNIVTSLERDVNEKGPNMLFLHSSGGLVLLYILAPGIGGGGEGIYVLNLLTKKYTCLPTHSDFLRAELAVLDAYAGVYKVFLHFSTATYVWDSMSLSFEELKTPKSYREQGLTGCLLAAKTLGGHIAHYLTQFVTSKPGDWAKTGIQDLLSVDEGQKDDKGVTVLQSHGEECIGAVIFRQGSVLTFRLYAWGLSKERLALDKKLLGEVVLSRSCKISPDSIRRVNAVLAEGLVLVWSLFEPQIQPAVFNLQTLTWSRLSSYLGIPALFKPNLLASPSYIPALFKPNLLASPSYIPALFKPNPLVSAWYDE